MSLDEYELIGVWSAGEGYYGHTSDTWLIFKPDGTGRVEFATWGHGSANCFQWKLVVPGVLELVGSHFHFTNVSFIVAEKERPPGSGQWMTTLQLAAPAPYPTYLGLVTRDLSGWDEPRV